MDAIKDEYDLVVVGAGPAGCWTAKTAAEQGLKTLLIEEHPRIGIPLQCAEGVNKNELEKFIEPNQKWIATSVNGAKIFSPGNIVIKINDSSNEGFILERKIFDRELAKRALKCGARILVNTKAVELIRENYTIKGVKAVSCGKEIQIHAKITIGADGINSRIRKLAGLNVFLSQEDMVDCAEYLLFSPEITSGEYIEIHFGKKIAPGGYAWIFPKDPEGEIANVGIGISRKENETKEIQRITPFSYLQKFLSKRFHKWEILEIIGGTVPASGPLKRLTRNGLMLVGDAACQTNPITGGGITNALEAGEIAGKIAAEAIKANDVTKHKLQEYEKIWYQRKGKQMNRLAKAKRVIDDLSDQEIDQIAKSLGQTELVGVSSYKLVKYLVLRNPKILGKLIRII